MTSLLRQRLRRAGKAQGLGDDVENLLYDTGATAARGVRSLRDKLANDAGRPVRTESDEAVPAGVQALTPAQAAALAQRLSTTIRHRAPGWDVGGTWAPVLKQLDRADAEKDPRRRLEGTLAALDGAQVLDPSILELVKLQVGELYEWVVHPDRQVKLIKEGYQQGKQAAKDEARAILDDLEEEGKQLVKAAAGGGLVILGLFLLVNLLGGRK